MTDDELDRRLRETILSEEVDASRLATVVRNQIRASRNHAWGWGVAAAAILLTILAGTISYRALHQERTSLICAAAAQDHQREIVEGAPRRWLGHLSAIQALAQKQGVPVDAIAALSASGYRLERARLCFLEKQIFLHLVYTKDGRQYSVYLRPSDGPPRNPLVQGTQTLAYFQSARVTAVFVSSALGADAMAFARAGAKAL